MGCLVVLFVFAAGFWGLCTIATFVDGVAAAKVLASIIEIALVALFIVCLKKYRSPENQEKMKKAQEKWAEYKAKAPERNKQQAELQAIRREAERKRTTIVSTRLIGEGSAEYKKGVGNMLVRGAVGGFFAGAAGATLGMATAKNKNTNKNVRRFLVKYLDGHVEEKEATIGSAKYKEYMEHLVWEEQ
jgi:hypothetical protein